MGEIIVAVFGIYLILQMIIGYRRGLIKSMLNLASWILTFAIAYKGEDCRREVGRRKRESVVRSVSKRNRRGTRK